MKRDDVIGLRLDRLAETCKCVGDPVKPHQRVAATDMRFDIVGFYSRRTSTKAASASSMRPSLQEAHWPGCRVRRPRGSAAVSEHPVERRAARLLVAIEGQERVAADRSGRRRWSFSGRERLVVGFEHAFVVELEGEENAAEIA